MHTSLESKQGSLWVDELSVNKQNLWQWASAHGFLDTWATCFWNRVAYWKPQGKIALKHKKKKHSTSYWAIYPCSRMRAGSICVNGLHRVHGAMKDEYWIQVPLKEIKDENIKIVFVLSRNTNINSPVTFFFLFHEHLRIVTLYWLNGLHCVPGMVLSAVA